ncbi:YHS domain-containing (seleno)protein [Tenacibaculum sp. 1_MG-2023]|uniref:YHS domain-containing (seleno)protein n=1 Tax=Tenacibaculum sp. 1_MG-2023 TaxID=3062653 RepID=UPI0026E1965E|nr:YHS domain-containing (seleno)protein [Tenacibaculum sp. 1_MG-2023]MDO6673966.1 YHS domain-containing (seleno)protein [Tenacibaculum sp. 1_MG-2023]
MKHLFIIFLLFSTITFSQEYNTKNGVAVKGYDVVSYFHDIAEKGNKKFTTKYNGVSFRFSSKENLGTFLKNPKKYNPQYGGYCAYAIGKTGAKVDINPKTFEIRDGKLYLFYNSWGTNTLKMWLKENPEKLKKQADINWRTVNQ